jgi:hypothetical protein
LQHGFANSQHIVELLGIIGAAKGPEPAANATGHNYYKSVVVYH